MSDPVVKIENGLVRGVVEKHEEGFTYYAFRGVPYAEPPIGELRFEDPVPKKDWTGVIDCKDYTPMCLQFNFASGRASHNEDCLYLNVFTGCINQPPENMPVMMVIHGGVYLFGSSDDFIYGPEYLIRKNVVLVTINYRLGVLGFLNLEDEIAPGNQGFKDLVQALQWIQQNIRMFGGDPNNVTIFGAASGGAAGHALALSPLSKDLFHKLIAQGATLFNPWVYIKNPRQMAIEFCSLLGKQLTDSKEIKNFLKTVDSKDLQEKQELLRKATGNLPFGAGTDSKSPRPFMPVDREILAKESIHIPCLLGCSTLEGIIFLAGDLFMPGKLISEVYELASQNFEYIFERHKGKDILHRYGVNGMQMKRLYYQNEIVSEKNVDKFVELTTDVYFTEGIHKFARQQSEQSSASTYLYKFDYNAPHSIIRMAYNDLPDGPSHFDDLPFLFKTHVFEIMGREHFRKGTPEYRIMEQLTEMWTNFAKYGRPTVETTELIPVHWQPVANGNVLRYLNIDEDITMQSTINVDQKILSAKNIKV